VVKEGRILKKIKQLQNQIVSVFLVGDSFGPGFEEIIHDGESIV